MSRIIIGLVVFTLFITLVPAKRDTNSVGDYTQRHRVGQSKRTLARYHSFLKNEELSPDMQSLLAEVLQLRKKRALHKTRQKVKKWSHVNPHKRQKPKYYLSSSVDSVYTEPTTRLAVADDSTVSLVTKPMSFWLEPNTNDLKPVIPNRNSNTKFLPKGNKKFIETNHGDVDDTAEDDNPPKEKEKSPVEDKLEKISEPKIGAEDVSGLDEDAATDENESSVNNSTVEKREVHIPFNIDDALIPVPLNINHEISVLTKPTYYWLNQIKKNADNAPNGSLEAANSDLANASASISSTQNPALQVNPKVVYYSDSPLVEAIASDVNNGVAQANIILAPTPLETLGLSRNSSNINSSKEVSLTTKASHYWTDQLKLDNKTAAMNNITLKIKKELVSVNASEIQTTPAESKRINISNEVSLLTKPAHYWTDAYMKNQTDETTKANATNSKGGQQRAVNLNDITLTTKPSQFWINQEAMDKVKLQNISIINNRMQDTAQNHGDVHLNVTGNQNTAAPNENKDQNLIQVKAEGTSGFISDVHDGLTANNSQKVIQNVNSKIANDAPALSIERSSIQIMEPIKNNFPIETDNKHLLEIDIEAFTKHPFNEINNLQNKTNINNGMIQLTSGDGVMDNLARNTVAVNVLQNMSQMNVPIAENHNTFQNVSLSNPANIVAQLNNDAPSFQNKSNGIQNLVAPISSDAIASNQIAKDLSRNETNLIKTENDPQLYPDNLQNVTRNTLAVNDTRKAFSVNIVRNATNITNSQNVSTKIMDTHSGLQNLSQMIAPDASHVADPKTGFQNASLTKSVHVSNVAANLINPAAASSIAGLHSNFKDGSLSNPGNAHAALSSNQPPKTNFQNKSGLSPIQNASQSNVQALANHSLTRNTFSMNETIRNDNSPEVNLHNEAQINTIDNSKAMEANETAKTSMISNVTSVLQNGQTAQLNNDGILHNNVSQNGLEHNQNGVNSFASNQEQEQLSNPGNTRAALSSNQPPKTNFQNKSSPIQNASQSNVEAFANHSLTRNTFNINETILNDNSPEVNLHHEAQINTIDNSKAMEANEPAKTNMISNASSLLQNGQLNNDGILHNNVSQNDLEHNQNGVNSFASNQEPEQLRNPQINRDQPNVNGPPTDHINSVGSSNVQMQINQIKTSDNIPQNINQPQSNDLQKNLTQNEINNPNNIQQNLNEPLNGNSNSFASNEIQKNLTQIEIDKIKTPDNIAQNINGPSNGNDNSFATNEIAKNFTQNEIYQIKNSDIVAQMNPERIANYSIATNDHLGDENKGQVKNLTNTVTIQIRSNNKNNASIEGNESKRTSRNNQDQENQADINYEEFHIGCNRGNSIPKRKRRNLFKRDITDEADSVLADEVALQNVVENESSENDSKEGAGSILKESLRSRLDESGLENGVAVDQNLENPKFVKFLQHYVSELASKRSYGSTSETPSLIEALQNYINAFPTTTPKTIPTTTANVTTTEMVVIDMTALLRTIDVMFGSPNYGRFSFDEPQIDRSTTEGYTNRFDFDMLKKMPYVLHPSPVPIQPSPAVIQQPPSPVNVAVRKVKDAKPKSKAKIPIHQILKTRGSNLDVNAIKDMNEDEILTLWRSVKQLHQDDSLPSNNSTDTLAHITELVDDIQQGKNGRSANGMSCSFNGSWLSSTAGMRIDIIQKEDKTFNVTLASKTPLPKGGLLYTENCTDWVLSARFPMKKTSIIQMTGINEKEKKLAVFLGECRACNDKFLVYGHWIVVRESHDCEDIGSNLETYTDVWRSESLHILRKSKLQQLKDAMPTTLAAGETIQGGGGGTAVADDSGHVMTTVADGATTIADASAGAATTNAVDIVVGKKRVAIKP